MYNILTSFYIASYKVEYILVYFNKTYGSKWYRSVGDQSSNGVNSSFICKENNSYQEGFSFSVSIALKLREISEVVQCWHSFVMIGRK